MSETTNKARVLLANVMCGPWRVATITEDGNPEPKQILVIDADRDQIASVEVRNDAELFAAAPTLITTLCDEAVEAEAGAAVMREALTAMRDARNAAIAKGHHEGTALHLEFWARMVQKDALDGSAGRAILDRIERAETERDALRAERAALRAVVCIDCGGTGGKRPNVGSTILYPPGTHCDKCGGSGAVIVKGDT